MKRYLTAVTISFCFLASQSSGSEVSTALDLQSVFEAAIKRSEVISDQEEQLKQAEEHYSQAMGSVLPTVSGIASYTRQKEVTSATGNALFPTSQPLVRLNATQPLFRGLRDIAAIRASRYLISAQEETKKQALRQLYIDVAQNYYVTLSLETDLKNIREEIELYEKRIKELRDRVKIGRSKHTEVLTMATSLNLLRVQFEQIKGQLSASRELFAFFTGLPVTTVLQATVTIPETLEPIENYTQSIDAQPVVKSAELKFKVAGENTKVAWRSHLPSIDLSGNYYLKRFGVLENLTWDVGVNLTLPIFNGGVIQSKYHEAASQEMQSELNLSRTKRKSLEEIKSLYQNVLSDLAQLKALKEAVELSQKTFNEETRDYRLGLVTNLEVLQSLTAFEESKRAYDRARYLGVLDFAKLEVVTGKNSQLERVK